MKIDHCQRTIDVSKIKLEECGKKAVFVNDKRKQFVITMVDSCVVPKGRAAEFVVSRKDCCDIVVELKGRDIYAGLKQVTDTAELWRQHNLFISKRVSALIVTNGCRPQFNTMIQKAKETFRKKKVSAPLHVVTGNYEYEIDAVLSFRGPHRI